jgi:hypothetical protein
VKPIPARAPRDSQTEGGGFLLILLIPSAVSHLIHSGL